MALNEVLTTILSAWPGARHEQFTQHQIARELRNSLPLAMEQTLKPETLNNLEFKGSAGQGVWTHVPWAAVFDTRFTTTAQNGVYPVYLFNAEGTGVYLSLGFGATKLKEGRTLQEAREVASRWRGAIRSAIPELSAWNTDVFVNEAGQNGADYNWASAGAKYYSLEDLKDKKTIESDFKELVALYKKLIDYIDSGKLLLDSQPVSYSYSSSIKQALKLPKPFILLAGISGTGKTRFVREQAKVTSSGNKNYEIVPVRPDWHEPSDLLGYISRLGEQPEYVPTKVLSFIAQAWAHLEPTIEIDESGRAWWVVQDTENVCPYWLCLDEMNLAPVEQYFADYLSVLETREFDHRSDSLKYRSDALVSADLINGLNAEAARNLKDALRVSDSLFEYFKEHGIPLPLNLIIAGTVNMDETTHGFSRKVIDRAFTIDFGLFFENNFDEFFDGQPNIQPLTFSTVTDAREPGLFNGSESFRDQSINFLTEVNSVLKGTPFELAFRALNELLLSVHCFNPTSERELAAVWDDFLMTKVLPRIEGDSDKLSLPDTDFTSSDNNVLSALQNVLERDSAFNQILASERTDFFRTDSNGDALNIACRSIDAIKRMQTRLETNGYTSFWP